MSATLSRAAAHSAGCVQSRYVCVFASSVSPKPTEKRDASAWYFYFTASYTILLQLVVLLVAPDCTKAFLRQEARLFRFGVIETGPRFGQS